MFGGKRLSQARQDRALRITPWLVAVGFFMENLDSTILNTVVPVISRDLGITALSMKSVVTTYTLTLVIFIPISGWMADRFGTRRVFRFAVAVFSLGSLACGLSQSLAMMIGARMLQGIGGAMIAPAGRLILVQNYPKADLVRVMNYVVIPALVAPMLGPFLGGLIVQWLPWRTIFFVNLPIGLAGWYLVGRFMPDHRDPQVPPMDRWGFVLFGAGVGLLSYVLEVFGEHNLTAAPLAGLSALSMTFLAAYGLHVRRTPKPLLSLALFKVRTFKISVIGGFVTRLGVSGMPFLLPLLYQIGMGYTPLQAGLFTVPQALGSIGMKVMSTKLLARFGFRLVLLWNTLLTGLTILAFSLVGPGVPIAAILVLTLFQGIFSSIQFTCLNTLVYADVADADESMANSLSTTFRQMALGFGVAGASLVAALFLGPHITEQDTALYVTGLHRTFIVLGIATIVSGFTFLGLHRDDGENVSGNVVEGRAHNVGHLGRMLRRQ